MNQPTSSCLSYHEEIMRLNARATELFTTGDNLNLTSSSSSVGGPYPSHDVPLATMSPDWLPQDPTIESDFLPLTAINSLTTNSTMDIDSASSDSPFFRETFPGAAQTFGRAASFMDVFDADVHADKRKQYPYYPFASKGEWQLASFLLCSDLSMGVINKFLKLELVSNHNSIRCIA